MKKQSVIVYAAQENETGKAPVWRRRLFSLLSLCCAASLVFFLSLSSALAEDDFGGDAEGGAAFGQTQNPVRIDDGIVYQPIDDDIYYPPEDSDFVFIPPVDPWSIDNTALLIGWLMDNGYTQQSAAAIGGNLQSESYGINPLRLEGGVGNGRSHVDENFRAINHYGHKTYIGGFGISQWTSYGRVLNLQTFADTHNLPVTSIEAQLRFLIIELERYDMTPAYLNSLSLEEATFAIYRYYLTPGSSLWTWQYYDGRYRYFNDYSPTEYMGGDFPLSETATPSAFRAFNYRLERALPLLEIEPERSVYRVYNEFYEWINDVPVLIEPKFVVEWFVMPEPEIRDDISYDEFPEFEPGEVSGVAPDGFVTFGGDGAGDDVGGGSSGGNVGSGAAPANPQPQVPTAPAQPTAPPAPVYVEPVQETVELPLLNLR